MQTTRLLRRLATTAVAASLLIGVATADAAQTGRLWHPHANCYSDGTVSTTLWYDKIGVGGQSLRYNIHYWDIDRGAFTRSTGNMTWYSGYGVAATPVQDYRYIGRGRYYVYVEFGWNLGSGWSSAGIWAGSYLTVSGGYFGAQESFCRAAPQNQVVGGNCNTFGGVVGCASRASAPAAKRVRLPTSRAAIERLQNSRRGRRLMRVNLPAPH